MTAFEKAAFPKLLLKLRLCNGTVKNVYIAKY